MTAATATITATAASADVRRANPFASTGRRDHTAAAVFGPFLDETAVASPLIVVATAFAFALGRSDRRSEDAQHCYHHHAGE